MLRNRRRWQLAKRRGGGMLPPMNVIPADKLPALESLLRKACPRLTPVDLAEAQGRVDLLTAKIQNRHWMDRVAARRVVLGLMQQAGIQQVA